MSTAAAKGRKVKHLAYLFAVGALILAITLTLILAIPYGAPIDRVIRGTALYAYLCLYAAILSSNYVVELTRFFGTRFVKIHHSAALTALILLLAHGALVASRSGSLSAFVPDTSSWYAFFLFAGRPALYLLLAASLAAVWRAKWRRGWRSVHWLTYLAFVLGTVHGWMLAISFGSTVARVIIAAMAASAIFVFALKRRPKRRPARRATS